jgi:error-prone DNA polymerase
MVNVIVWKRVAQEQRRALLESSLLGVEGQWQAAEGVCNLVARRLVDLSAVLGNLDVRSRDFR